MAGSSAVFESLIPVPALIFYMKNERKAALLRIAADKALFRRNCYSKNELFRLNFVQHAENRV